MNTRSGLSSVVAGIGLSLALIAPASARTATPRTPSAPATLSDSNSIVVKMAPGHSVTELTNMLPLQVQNAVLASRGIYLMNTAFAWTGGAQGWANFIGRTGIVKWAEPDMRVQLADTRFHAWPYGSYSPALPSQYASQPVFASLRQAQTNPVNRGSGQKIAVLDTGADGSVPALAGHLGQGYDYIGDDSNTGDAPDHVDSDGNGVVDGALGHGTFVAGLIRLVAPDATIIPERVLDSDGTGNIFVVAQAIDDAVAQGASVINLSLGTSSQVASKLLDDSIANAQSQGVVVVAAAGNTDLGDPTYPAARPGVLSVAALNSTGAALAPYSTYGSWVQVAASGSNLVGPLPGGGYGNWSGTSMASPIVAGQVALLKSKYPAWNSIQVIAKIVTTANPQPGGAPLNISGGAVNVVASLG